MDGTDFLLFLLFAWLAMRGFKKMATSFDTKGEIKEAVKNGILGKLSGWFK